MAYVQPYQVTRNVTVPMRGSGVKAIEEAAAKLRAAGVPDGAEVTLLRGKYGYESACAEWKEIAKAPVGA